MEGNLSRHNWTASLASHFWGKCDNSEYNGDRNQAEHSEYCSCCNKREYPGTSSVSALGAGAG